MLVPGPSWAFLFPKISMSQQFIFHISFIYFHPHLAFRLRYETKRRVGESEPETTILHLNPSYWNLPRTWNISLPLLQPFEYLMAHSYFCDSTNKWLIFADFKCNFKQQKIDFLPTWKAIFVSSTWNFQKAATCRMAL